MASSPHSCIPTASSPSHYHCIYSGSSSSLLLLGLVLLAAASHPHGLVHFSAAPWLCPDYEFTASPRPRSFLRFSASPPPCPHGRFPAALCPLSPVCSSAFPRPRHIYAALLLLVLVLCPVSLLPLGVVLCAASGRVQGVEAPPACSAPEDPALGVWPLFPG